MLCKRGLCRHAVSVCLSVCPSRSCILSKRINISSKFFSPSGSQGIIIFQYQTPWQYSDGNPPNEGVECRWGRQKSRLWAYMWLNCLMLALQQSRCCQNGRRWTTVTVQRPTSWVWHIAGSKRRCWLQEKTTKCLWQKASTSRQRQQNSAFNCTQW